MLQFWWHSEAARSAVVAMAAEHHAYGAFGSSGALPPAAATTAVATLAQSDECNDHTDREGAGRWQAAWRRSIASLAVCAGLGLAATRVLREPPARSAGSAGLSSADRSSAEHTPTDSLPATALESSDGASHGRARRVCACGLRVCVCVLATLVVWTRTARVCVRPALARAACVCACACVPTDRTTRACTHSTRRRGARRGRCLGEHDATKRCLLRRR